MLVVLLHIPLIELTDNGGSATIKDGVRSDREGYPLNSVFGLRILWKDSNAGRIGQIYESLWRK